MLVMTTQHLDGVLLEEKGTPKGALVVEEIRNGTPELNGHQDSHPLKPKSESVPILDSEANLEKNDDAFSSNQAVADKPNGTTNGTATALEREESAEVKETSKSDASAQQSGSGEMDAADEAMVNEPTTAPAHAPTAPLTQDHAADAEAIAHGHSPSAPITDLNSPLSAIPSPAQEDMHVDESRPTAQDTQDTVMSDAPPHSPFDDTKEQATTTNPKSPPLPTTADTSLSEPSQPTKVARAREVDSEDEPVAKRAKVSPAGDQVQVKPPPKDDDKMDLDKPSTPAPSLAQDAKGKEKRLDDPSLATHPMTEYMARQLRLILAGVKKTKAGANFKSSVETLWPHLWPEYSAKVPSPIDISMMERKLRGELPKYTTMRDFLADIDLLVANSILFNGENHDVTLSAKSTRDGIQQRMALVSALEPSKPEKKEPAKQHPTRHTEPRTQTKPPASSPAGPSLSSPAQSKTATAAPAPKPAVTDSPAFAIPANNNGMPIIRRDSTKGDGRVKRPVKPAHPKDLVYDTKRKKKLPPELRFCDEVLTEIRKQKYFDINNAFLQPVDPVALNIPSYHKIVKKPMDLQTMGNKMNAGEYTSAKEFEKDFDLIVKNCRLFNGEEHPVYDAAVKLQQLFRKEFSKKDDWMAKHAPAPTPFQSNLSPIPKDDSDDEDHESEGEPEADPEQKALQTRVATIQKRLEEESKKLNDMINSGTADEADVDITQSVVALLQKQLMGERGKLNALQAKKPAKAKASKPKKAGVSGSGGGKKAGGASAAGGSGGFKKTGGAKKPAKKKMGALEKEVIAGGIAELDGGQLERAIDIIKKDTGQGENDSGELELDIEQLSEDALVRLYDLVTKAFPNLKAEKEKTFAAPPVPVQSTPARPKGVAKSKKNKPMSRVEQERRLQQLTELRAQAGRQGSGSQEPMESIEGNGNGTGRGSTDPLQNPEVRLDSDDEESSEEE
ncbi:Bromodomain-containing factor 1 [Echria macrotheca]|uniref:Bromodomain-containing factor 1 n=1 Tax=Echria macrotheca TaxID=438768 RepID=A0AAJ0B651_9PEZI|nr:Bromodomain-containing factor 1 [Echria macrotheca]